MKMQILKHEKDLRDHELGNEITNGVVLLRREDGVWTNIPHVVIEHSPTGYEWGYTGSGPADLALNICEIFLNRMAYAGPRVACWDGTCFELAYRLHQSLKVTFIMTTAKRGGQIPYAVIEEWIREAVEARGYPWITSGDDEDYAPGSVEPKKKDAAKTDEEDYDPDWPDDEDFDGFPF